MALELWLSKLQFLGMLLCQGPSLLQYLDHERRKPAGAQEVSGSAGSQRERRKPAGAQEASGEGRGSGGLRPPRIYEQVPSLASDTIL